MINKSPKTALKVILCGVLFASFIFISCNDKKKTTTTTTTDTTKGPDTANTKPVVDPPSN